MFFCPPSLPPSPFGKEICIFFGALPNSILTRKHMFFSKINTLTHSYRDPFPPSSLSPPFEKNENFFGALPNSILTRKCMFFSPPTPSPSFPF